MAVSSRTPKVTHCYEQQNQQDNNCQADDPLTVRFHAAILSGDRFIG
jgi:hypothetical protein